VSNNEGNQRQEQQTIRVGNAKGFLLSDSSVLPKFSINSAGFKLFTSFVLYM